MKQNRKAQDLFDKNYKSDWRYFPTFETPVKLSLNEKKLHQISNSSTMKESHKQTVNSWILNRTFFANSIMFVRYWQKNQESNCHSVHFSYFCHLVHFIIFSLNSCHSRFTHCFKRKRILGIVLFLLAVLGIIFISGSRLYCTTKKTLTANLLNKGPFSIT